MSEIKTIISYCVLITIVLFGMTYGLALFHKSELTLVNSEIPPECLLTRKSLDEDESFRLDSCEVRQWYNEKIDVIPSVLNKLNNQHLPLRKKAYCAYTIRHQARLIARQMMSSRLEVAFLRVRDLFTYGHFDGPEFEELAGENPDKSDYSRIIESSQETDQNINEDCGINNNSGISKHQ